MSSIIKHARNIFIKAKNKRNNTSISYLKSNISNHLKTSNIDSVKIMSKFPYSTVSNKSSPNTLITLPKIVDTESSFVSMTK